MDRLYFPKMPTAIVPDPHGLLESCHQEVETISPPAELVTTFHEQNVAKAMGCDFRGYTIKFSIIPPGVLILSF